MSASAPQDGKQREFICPCGKAYLSYPALFTHIKQKHDGKVIAARCSPRERQSGPKFSTSAEDPAKVEAALHSLDGCRKAKGLAFNREEEIQFKSTASQPPPAKQRYKPTREFIAPIPTSLLCSQQPPVASPPRSFREPRADPQQYQQLRLEFKGIFEGLHGSGWLSGGQLEGLVRRNAVYREARLEERRSSRRPMGYDSWEMELRTALFEFLDWAEDSFSRWEYRNLELLVALVVYYYRRNEERATTGDYTSGLPSASAFVKRVGSLSQFQNVYILQGGNYVRTMMLVHLWLRYERLSTYEMEESFLLGGGGQGGGGERDGGCELDSLLGDKL